MVTIRTIWYQSPRIKSAIVNIPPRRRANIGQGRPVANTVLLEEIQNLSTRMETMETTQRRGPDEGDANATDESFEE